MNERGMEGVEDDTELLNKLKGKKIKYYILV